MSSFIKTGKYFLILASLCILSILPAQANTVDKLDKKSGDVLIMTNVKAKYVQEKSLSAFKIHVSARKGKVTLTGEVDNSEQYGLAVQLAESTDGVTDVDANDLKVKNVSQPLKDAYITATIKGRLFKHHALDKNVDKAFSVNVTTEQGNVILTKDVQTDVPTEQMNVLLQIAKSTKGVKSVKVVN